MKKHLFKVKGVKTIALMIVSFYFMSVSNASTYSRDETFYMYGEGEDKKEKISCYKALLKVERKGSEVGRYKVINETHSHINNDRSNTTVNTDIEYTGKAVLTSYNREVIRLPKGSYKCLIEAVFKYVKYEELWVPSELVTHAELEKLDLKHGIGWLNTKFSIQCTDLEVESSCRDRLKSSVLKSIKNYISKDGKFGTSASSLSIQMLGEGENESYRDETYFSNRKGVFLVEVIDNHKDVISGTYQNQPKSKIKKKDYMKQAKGFMLQTKDVINWLKELGKDLSSLFGDVQA